MPSVSKTHARCTAVVAAVLSAGLAGCSEQTAKVSGLVSLDGQILKLSGTTRGRVEFVPVEGGANCAGTINEEGRYTVATGSSGSLVPGDYLVSVRVVELIEAEVEGMPPTARPITPAVYADALSSGISFMVSSGVNDCDIELDSAAGPTVLPTEPVEAVEEDAPTEPVAEAESAEPPIGEAVAGGATTAEGEGEDAK